MRAQRGSALPSGRGRRFGVYILNRGNESALIRVVRDRNRHCSTPEDGGAWDQRQYQRYDNSFTLRKTDVLVDEQSPTPILLPVGGEMRWDTPGDGKPRLGVVYSIAREEITSWPEKIASFNTYIYPATLTFFRYRASELAEKVRRGTETTIVAVSRHYRLRSVAMERWIVR